MKKPERNLRSGLDLENALDRIRTCDLRLRRPTLYPAELRARCVGRRNKPSSVSARSGGDHFSGTAVTDGLEQPTRDCGVASAGRAAPRPLFGLAPGGVCHAASVTSRAVRSYRTLSPLPVPADSGPAAIGGLLSVALSVALRRPGVTRHPALWSSDFPRWHLDHSRLHRDPHSPPDMTSSFES